MVHTNHKGIIKSTLEIGDLCVVLIGLDLDQPNAQRQCKIGRMTLVEDHLTISDTETPWNKLGQVMSESEARQIVETSRVERQKSIERLQKARKARA